MAKVAFTRSRGELWLAKVGQPDEWMFYPTAAKFQRIRHEHDEVNETNPQSRVEASSRPLFVCWTRLAGASPQQLAQVIPHPLTNLEVP